MSSSSVPPVTSQRVEFRRPGWVAGIGHLSRGRRAEPNLRKLREAFKDKLRYGYKDFPLPIREYAEKAGEAARCAGAQGQFWALHDRLFEGDSSSCLAVPALKTAARDMKLDGARFDKCLDSGEMAMAIS